MTRPSSIERACLDAQVRSQVAQQLTAELAVSCPDCGVEAGRACRDSFDRAVRTHLARAAAANRRDTEPCPGPDVEAWLREDPDMRFLIVRHGDSLALISGKELAPAPERAPAIAPEAVASSRPQYDSCKECGQTIWAVTAGMLGYAMELCGDCCAAHNKGLGDEPEDALDQRIREAQAKSDDATECAWSTPTSEGEGWRRG